MDTKKFDELRPCPFCGGKAIANIKEPERVNCSTEGCYQSEAWREYGMRPQTWNTRPLEDTQAARIHSLEAELAVTRKANDNLRANLARTDHDVKEKALVQEILTLHDEKAQLEDAWQKELKRAKELEAQNDATCMWRYDPDGPWETSCGGAWEFIDDGPEENNCLYCPHCGKRIVIERQEVENDDDDNFVESEVKP
jgi:DNA-directed RNA polymerase subunit RPC12/RpoP